MEISDNKSQLRKQYRKERQDRFEKESWLHILSAGEFKEVKNVGSYISYEYEPETSDLNKLSYDYINHTFKISLV